MIGSLEPQCGIVGHSIRLAAFAGAFWVLEVVAKYYGQCFTAHVSVCAAVVQAIRVCMDHRLGLGGTVES